MNENVLFDFSYEEDHYHLDQLDLESGLGSMSTEPGVLREAPDGLKPRFEGGKGASPDGLIGADGGAEYKCLVSPERLRDTLVLNDISDFMDQVQGGMWITGRKWWDFCIYCPALAPVGRDFSRWRVPRDDEYIAALEQDLIEFSCLVDTYEQELRKPLPMAA